MNPKEEHTSSIHRKREKFLKCFKRRHLDISNSDIRRRKAKQANDLGIRVKV